MKNKNKQINQASFYFEDYLETNKNRQAKKTNNFQDRIYILFFLFSLILIFLFKIVYVSLTKKEISLNSENSQFSY